MGKLLFIVVLAAALVAPVFASPTVTMSVGPGGHPYKATVASEGLGGYAVGDFFWTFCVEKDEYVGNGGTYWVDISDGAVFGGIGGQNPAGAGYDPLDPRTAWLYNEFLDNGVGPYNSSQLQDAIWMIEEELTWSNSNPFIISLDTYAGSYEPEEDFSWAAQGTGDIYVMNLWNHETLRESANKKQDQLIRVSGSPPPPIPAPGALLLGSMGAGIVGWMRRRRTL